MATKLVISGQISVPSDDCGCSGGASFKQQGLSLGCNGKSYAQVVSTDVKQQVSTPGAVGDAWVELPVAGDIGLLELLFVRSSSQIRLRLNSAPPVVSGTGGSFPTGFGGGETLEFDAGGLSVDVTFTAAAQSAQQVANEVNARAAMLGASFQPASVVSGQLRLTGPHRGPEQSVEVTSGNATIGLGAQEVFGAGDVVPVYGLFLSEFGGGGAGVVDVSGNAQVEVLAAGQSS